ncbi:hypothetical protein HK098_008191 [Nowakowskiella sp. JEL0407]|nr:hypothetical protein HK098_008191 [Nowakowskiella sp. JEL0407]
MVLSNRAKQRLTVGLVTGVALLAIITVGAPTLIPGLIEDKRPLNARTNSRNQQPKVREKGVYKKPDLNDIREE